MYGTAPEKVQQIIFDNWQASRTGRPDVPALVTDGGGNPSTDPDDGARGEVMVLKNRERVGTNRAAFDTIACYHPDANPMDVTDNGYKENRVDEYVQVDIDLTDRPDPATGERVTARERMVGDRDDASFSGADAPYPGILGEVMYIFESVRRGVDEYDTITATPMGGTLLNSDAVFRIDVTLTILSKPTV